MLILNRSLRIDGHIIIITPTDTAVTTIKDDYVTQIRINYITAVTNTTKYIVYKSN